QLGGYARAVLLSALGPRLTPAGIDAAVAAAREIDTADDRAWALMELAGWVTEGGEGVVAEALSAARSITDPTPHALALREVTKRLSGVERDEAVTEAVAAARAVTGIDRLWALISLAPVLPERERDLITAEALDSATSLESDTDRARVLQWLVP